MYHQGSKYDGAAVSFTRNSFKTTREMDISMSSPILGGFQAPHLIRATRAACFTMLRSLLPALPQTWNVRLLPDHQPQLEVETVVTLPITVTNLVTELTSFLLILSPYLDLLDQTGVTAVTGGPLPAIQHVVTPDDSSRPAQRSCATDVRPPSRHPSLPVPGTFALRKARSLIGVDAPPNKPPWRPWSEKGGIFSHADYERRRVKSTLSPRRTVCWRWSKSRRDPVWLTRRSLYLFGSRLASSPPPK